MLKIWTFYFGRLIFGHFFSHFRQISDKNFGHFAEICLKFTPTKHELDSSKICENDSFTTHQGFTDTPTRK